MNDPVMDERRCLVRTETISNRIFPLLVFPDLPPIEGRLSVWSPIDGYGSCDRAYILEHTQEASDAISQRIMARYESAFEKAQGPFKLQRLKKFPK